MDLSSYLSRADAARHRELRTFFGCLVRALEFLHEQSVRHKDVKPGNILVHGGKVLLTDFGLAFDFTDAEGSTTVSMVNGMTRRYCAPEVANHEARNTSSDIWSLGVVFLEMTSVLKSRSVEFSRSFLSEHGSRQAFVHTNPTGVQELIAEFKQRGDPIDDITLAWAQDMLTIQPNLRPTAASLMGSIVAAVEGGKGGFCGICCVSQDEVMDDFDELGILDDE
jgi:serine/threonine protein kinase